MPDTLKPKRILTEEQKDLHRGYVRKSRAKNREKINAQANAARLANPEKHRAAVRASHAKYRSKRLAYAKEYHIRNRDRHRAYDARPDRKEKRRISSARYRELNRERYLASKKKLRSTPKAVLENRLRSRLLNALKSKTGGKKCVSATKLCGCSILELVRHLESKFLSGMTWENRGRWHIDHIIPVSKFNLFDPEEQRRCFHFSNLQPLWKLDNLKKGCRLLPEYVRPENLIQFTPPPSPQLELFSVV